MGVIAINAKNGSELWKRTVKLSTVKDAQYLTRANRGITYGKNRIYLSTYDARIWSINATTGELDTEFKDNAPSTGGYITIADGDAGYYFISGSYLYTKRFNKRRWTSKKPQCLELIKFWW